MQIMLASIHLNPPPSDSNDTTRLQTYTNSQYKFSIQYPTGNLPQTDASSFSLDIKVPNSQEGPARVVVAARQDAGDCYAVPPGLKDEVSFNGSKDLGTIVINGTPFKAYSTGDAASGSRNDIEVYNAVKNGICYTVQSTLASYDMNRLQGEKLANAEVDLKYLSTTKNTIIYSLQIAQ
jgi:hypothetical protein